ncbi:MAG: transposase [Methanomicrobiaceae archaeon]|nr:transposase [Methanomicrobiaceae archaeon]
MRHVTRYRAYPSHPVEQRLFNGFARCSFVRHWCLETKVYRDSCLPKLKEEYPELKEVHSKVLQNVVQQIVHNLIALRGLKAKGRKAGKLRKKWLHSMIYEQSGFKLTGNRLWLSKIGEMRIELSRPVPGRIKQIVIKHTRAHKWFVAIISETPDTPEPTTGTRAVGIDLNLENFSTDTDGVVFEHPHNVRKAAKRLRRAQRQLSRAVKGSGNRRKQRVKVARIHEKVENRRNDFLHKWSRYYVDNYDHIALEHLNIKPMVESLESKLRGRSKAILDAAWYKARAFIQYKAANAGTYVHIIEPAYTTQDCFICGYREKKDLSQRTHCCPVCGYTVPRDLNAAQNILKRASVGWGTPESTLVETGTATPPILAVQVPINETRISRL